VKGIDRAVVDLRAVMVDGREDEALVAALGREFSPGKGLVEVGAVTGIERPATPKRGAAAILLDGNLEELCFAGKKSIESVLASGEAETDAPAAAVPAAFFGGIARELRYVDGYGIRRRLGVAGRGYMGATAKRGEGQGEAKERENVTHSSILPRGVA